jgi:uncharacterized phage protein gp47/JayE
MGYTFVTASGETMIGQMSNAVTLSASQALVTGIGLGGPGTLQRRLYRMLNGVMQGLVVQINDNSTTQYTDNVATPSVTQPPPVSTAQQVSVVAQSEQNGSAYNAVPGAINIISLGDSALTSVANPSAFIDGEDPQTVDSYRTTLLNWIRSPQTGSPSDLVNWALTVSGVGTAVCFPNQNMGVAAPGYATVLIGGTDGVVASPSVISAVETLLVSKTLANITIVVGTFTAVPTNVTVNITPISGYLTANLTPSIQTAISNYINNLAAGATMYLSEIIATVIGQQGVQDVQVTSPTENVTAPTSSDALTAGVITVTGSP